MSTNEHTRPSQIGEDEDNDLGGAEARVGSTLRGKWRLDALLGAGGMAVVYAATHCQNGGRAAVKMLRPAFVASTTTSRRFQREGYAANRVSHPGAVTVFDDDVAEDGTPFLVMELLEGETLASHWVSHGKRVPDGKVLEVVDQVLDVLAAAHEKGIAHRDIKPDNIFLCKSGEVKVLDFGIARVAEAEGGPAITRSTSMLGTPAYMAPEQARGHWDEVDGRADLWSVGATMFTLMTGRYLHECRTANEMLIAAATRPPRRIATLRPDLPRSIGAIVDRALQFDKTNRWPSAREMQEAIRREMAQLASSPPWLPTTELAEKGHADFNGTTLPDTEDPPSGDLTLPEDAGPTIENADAQPRLPPAVEMAPPRRKSTGRRLLVAAALGLVPLGAFLLWPSNPESKPAPASDSNNCPGAADWIGKDTLEEDCGPSAWENGQIPFEFHSSVQRSERQLIRAGMKRWEQVTHSRITFIELPTDPERVVIRTDLVDDDGKSIGCTSGLPGWDSAAGIQNANWPPGCPYEHELGHVIGLHHEHQRVDRERFIMIGPANTTCKPYAELEKTCGESAKANFGEYNLQSIMHYGCQNCSMKHKDGTDIWPNPARGSEPTVQDGSNVRELYADLEYGWSRFRSLGRDVGATQPLSAEFVPGVTVVDKPALASQNDGTNDLFVRGSDNKLWHRSRRDTTWSDWHDLGGSLASSPSATSWGAGSLLVVAKLSNGKIGIRQHATGSWSDWSELTAPAIGAASAPALSSQAKNKLDLFVRGTDNKLWWRSFSSALPPTIDKNWQPWTNQGLSFASDPAAASWGDGRVDVVMVAANGEMLRWASEKGGPMAHPLGCCADPMSSLAITSRASGQLNVILKGDGQLRHMYHLFEHWSRVADLGGVLASSPAISTTSSTRLDVVALGPDGVLKHRFWGR